MCLRTGYSRGLEEINQASIGLSSQRSVNKVVINESIVGKVIIPFNKELGTKRIKFWHASSLSNAKQLR
jgi:hypothetical protein